MKLTSSAVIIMVGFMLLYLTLTDKIDIFAVAFRQIFGLPSKGQKQQPTKVEPKYIPGTKTPLPYKMPKIIMPDTPRRYI